MPDGHRILGAEVSPYSVKVRSYFRYKKIPHEWVPRDANAMPEFQKHAKLPLIPLVITPEQQAIQDSTPIVERMEAMHPEPSIHPKDPTLAFLSALIEEFGDEWGNKWMFHYRWAREVDQHSAGRRIAALMAPDGSDEERAAVANGIVARMVGRTWFVGSNEQTAPQIEASWKEGLAQLNAHLAGRSYLFGERPAFGDFGLWGQVYNAWTDPTCGAMLEQGAPHALAWVERMLAPEALGEFETWNTLEATLTPFLERQVGTLFLPWSDANARAIAEGLEEFSVELDGKTWTQKPQKYHARSLAALRAKYAEVRGNAQLDGILESTGCLRWLALSD
ncbi:MAG: glutathione S-transferase family protein [Myxococcota bacterium]|jgi:glutathione S-transferase|nr:enoyl-CoA hydratase [Deltaproteobacteria bacterium]MCP4241768.1 glutathione S-transferase family protein [bacterium]MDP6075966.1 glutathione S-transferase family protein [Myxococcota bacterium]MDP6242349.1 glutathione S-transferase family protein [Myxococcota bacterium]MDP7076044.1 glutathione S-transferase family protein [Myxococcota bacterium]